MEGPSLVIACEELSPLLRKKIRLVSGDAVPKLGLAGLSKLTRVESWGKHLLLTFPEATLRIHFLMFGSYRIDDPREDRIPKLQLDYPHAQVYFYSCAVKVLEAGWRKTYDWSRDVMSERWDPKAALGTLRDFPDSQIADLLMDQDIFAGVGNIMKNEILFRLGIHPETRFAQLSPAEQRLCVKTARIYARQFYEWKKANVLKRNWLIMRKKTCPRCSGKVTKEKTGVLERWSHYCARCQPKR